MTRAWKSNTLSKDGRSIPIIAHVTPLPPKQVIVSSFSIRFPNWLTKFVKTLFEEIMKRGTLNVP